MFDSLSGGYVPICAAALVVAWFLAAVRSIWLRAALAVIAPVAISLAWYFLPALFKPSPSGDGEMGWGFITAATWSVAAVPVSVVAVFCFSYVRHPRRGV